MSRSSTFITLALRYNDDLDRLCHSLKKFGRYQNGTRGVMSSPGQARRRVISTYDGIDQS